MRSFLSRFTLYSVAAFGLGGLIAGCSGGSTSTSLPAAPVAVHGLHQSRAQLIAHMQSIGFKPMTRPQISYIEKKVAQFKAQYHKNPNGFSSGTGVPGAFGLVTTASPPGPYFGGTDQVSA
ncbi:MAG: hypothetical protein JO233_03325, partial [Candidatus Eremiobacteraeota bacterium]|nr:hypothetical protein [Candidatus Eremiobacteraeota bacterium]